LKLEQQKKLLKNTNRLVLVSVLLAFHHHQQWLPDNKHTKIKKTCCMFD